MTSFNNMVTVTHCQEWEEVTKLISWLSTPTFLTLSQCLVISATLRHVQQLHPKYLFCSPFPQYMKRKKVSIPSWPQFLTQTMIGQETWEGGRHQSILKLWFALSMILCIAATGKSWQEREKTISQSKWIYLLASQEELAVYPGMPNVQKICLGKGSGKCMFLFYPK